MMHLMPVYGGCSAVAVMPEHGLRCRVVNWTSSLLSAWHDLRHTRACLLACLLAVSDTGQRWLIAAENGCQIQVAAAQHKVQTNQLFLLRSPVL